MILVSVKCAKLQVCLTSTLICCAIDLVCLCLNGSDQQSNSAWYWTAYLDYLRSVSISFSSKVRLSEDGTTVNYSLTDHSSTEIYSS